MARLTSIILILALAGTALADGKYCGLVEWVFSDPSTVPQPQPQPTPDPSPYKCRYCKDTKVIVHGDGHTSPCPHCTPGTEVEKPRIVLSADYKYIKINDVWYQRKRAMDGVGQWVGIDVWSRCMGSYCERIKITDEKQLGFNPEDYIDVRN